MADYGEYMPHGMCLLWKPWLVLLWAGSDLLIFLSYLAIPIALFTVLRRRSEVPNARLVALFAAFILLCGITHLFMIVTLWIPIYPFVGWLKLATGLVSAATAVMLFRLVPDLIALPSPGALREANLDLQREIAAHKETLASLDRQVRERTRELESATTALAVQAREAVHRSSNLLTVVHALAVQSARGSASVEAFLASFVGRLRALADATQSIARGNAASARLPELVARALELLSTTYKGRVAITGPDLTINAAAAQQISLALHELSTNSHKYGLGTKEAVRVEVSWEVDAERLVFAWRESGIGPLAGGQQPPEGFGTMLLTSIIPETLDGTAERRFEAETMVYRLEVPLASVREKPSAESDTRLASDLIESRFRTE